MEISIALVAGYLLKLLILLVAEAFLCMVICWPVNDQPTSKTQWAIFAILSLPLIDFILIGFISYT